MSENRRTGEEWLAGVLAGLTSIGGERLEPFQQIRATQSAYRVLLQHETERLTRLRGEDDPRVLQMRNRLARNLTLVEHFEAEDQRRRTEVRKSSEKEALIHGRITDESARGLVGFSVMVTDEAGKDLGVAEANVDDTGYFAVPITEEQAARLAAENTRVYVAIKNRAGEICERRPISRSVGPGVRVTETVTLSRSRRDPAAAQPTGTPAATKAKTRKK